MRRRRREPAAEAVGPTGSVLGVDRSAEAVAAARARAGETGHHRIVQSWQRILGAAFGRKRPKRWLRPCAAWPTRAVDPRSSN
jgi:hypothetical protein